MNEEERRERNAKMQKLRRATERLKRFRATTPSEPAKRSWISRMLGRLGLSSSSVDAEGT
ncbi:MAG: hypothetical protein JXC32_01235 [Anaerolineae bacterium]|nr:hypothetical protein [Anaerolineae bacterium]